MYWPSTGRAFFFTLLFGPCPLVTFVAVSVAAGHSSRAADTTAKNLFIENLRIWWDCGFGGAGDLRSPRARRRGKKRAARATATRTVELMVGAAERVRRVGGLLASEQSFRDVGTLNEARHKGR